MQMNAPPSGTPLLSILDCARPILLYNESSEFPYSISGTAFVVRFRGRLFVVTANHCLRLTVFEAHQFRVQYRPDRPEMLALGAMSRFKKIDREDTDQNDLVTWEVESRMLNAALFGRYQPYTLAQDSSENLDDQSEYLYRGYPIALRQIDFDARRYEQPSIAGAADYVGRSPTIARVHTLRFRHFYDEITDLDGVSGAPVFLTRRLAGRNSMAKFAGMMLRGSREAMTGYFLEHQRVLELLTDVVEGRADERVDLPR